MRLIGSSAQVQKFVVFCWRGDEAASRWFQGFRLLSRQLLQCEFNEAPQLGGHAPVSKMNQSQRPRL